MDLGKKKRKYVWCNSKEYKGSIKQPNYKLSNFQGPFARCKQCNRRLRLKIVDQEPNAPGAGIDPWFYVPAHKKWVK